MSNYKSARAVLTALIEGVDPTTGDDLPTDTVLHKSAIIRALLVARNACDAMDARALRRAQLPGNVGRQWAQDEEENLVTEFKSGDSIAEMASKHGRTMRAIEARLEKLGLLAPEQRVTQSGFIHARPDDKA